MGKSKRRCNGRWEDSFAVEPLGFGGPCDSREGSRGRLMMLDRVP